MSNNDNELYSRQESLNLKRYSAVIIVGCGGVGNWVALDCALTGLFKSICVIDDDYVDEHNLNRTIFEICDIGSLKVDAIKNQILKRRIEQEVDAIAQRTNASLLNYLITKYIGDNSYYHDDVIIIDCRDDIYDDLYRFNCKLYKVGYDGMNITIDGNPRLTKVWTQRGGSYSITPSYVGSAQLASCLLLNDITYPESSNILTKDSGVDFDSYTEALSVQEDYPFLRDSKSKYDDHGRLNCCLSLQSDKILKTLIGTDIDMSYLNELCKKIRGED